MRIRFVWPRRFDPTYDLEPTTFFWLECSPDEAEAVFEGARVDAKTAFRFTDDIAAAREYLRANPSSDLDSPVGPGFIDILVSSNGKRIERPSRRLLNNENPHVKTPLVKIDAHYLNSFYDLKQVRQQIFEEHPGLSDEFDTVNIPERADFEKLVEKGIERYFGQLPKNADEAMRSNDDRLAMAIFCFMDPIYLEKPRFLPEEDSAAPVVPDLEKEYAKREGTLRAGNAASYPFEHLILCAKELPLGEIYQRRARAEKNVARLHSAAAGHEESCHALFPVFSGDEICEMLLLIWQGKGYEWGSLGDFIKPLLLEIDLRSGIYNFGPNHPEDWHLARLSEPHQHRRFRRDDESESPWVSIHEKAEEIATAAHAKQRDKAGVPYISHPARVVDNVRAYEEFLWRMNPQRVLELGGHALANIIDSAVTAAWLHDVIEDSGDYGVQITAEDLLSNGIPAKVVEAVELLSDTARVPSGTAHGIELKAKKNQLKLNYYKQIARNQIARIVKLADLADNNNLSRAELMRAAGGSVDPNRYPLALAALELSDEEWLWFNERIQRRVV
jgi:guanosine-3',5'-bis(diphosphate) 3'-pyrophosphohydrolase